MRRPRPPSVLHWLALGLVGLALLSYQPAPDAPAPSVPVPAVTEPDPTSPLLPAVRSVEPLAPAAILPVPATSPALALVPDPPLERLVRTVLGEAIDHYAVVVKDLEQGSGVAINADRVFYAASLFKLAVMYEAFQQDATGQLPLTTMLPVTAAAAAEDLGTLDLWAFEVGDAVSVGELVALMVTASDNTASVLLRDALGRERIDATMRTLGLRATAVSAPQLPTSAADMARLLEMIAAGGAVSEAASTAMRGLLQQQWVRDRIPAGLPADVPVANKTGSWSGATHDVAIVYAPTGTYLLAVLSDLPDEADRIAALSGAVYAYYADHER